MEPVSPYVLARRCIHFPRLEMALLAMELPGRDELGPVCYTPRKVLPKQTFNDSLNCIEYLELINIDKK